jgi:hypothetical protein
MSLSIISEPSTSTLVGAYIPGTNSFVVDVTVGSSESPPKLRSVINFYEVGTTSGALQTSVEIDHEYTTQQSSTVYRFNVDVSGRVQAYFNNLEQFHLLDTYSSGALDQYGCDYIATFTEIRSTGVDDTYQTVADTDSSSITIVNAFRPLTEAQNMDIYDANTTASNHFLTNKPDKVTVDYSTNEWLFAHDDDGKYFVNVEFYNPSLLATRQFYISGTTIGANNTGKIGVIGIGPVNIDAVGAAGRFLSGAAVPMEANGVTHYKVRVQNSGATEITPERTYRLSKCPIRYRIHFVNWLGGIDTLLVERSREDGFSVESESYYTPKHTGNSRTVSGVHTLRATGTKSVKFIKQGLSPDEFVWLQELATSPAISLEQDGIYIPLNLTKCEFEAEDEIGQFYKMEFEANHSNKIEGLRN